MATPIVSNSIAIVTAPEAPNIAIDIGGQTTITEPAAGGPLVINGKTNLPDGTTVHFLRNGSPDPTVADTTVAGGAFTFTWVDPANPSTLQERSDIITVTT